MKRKRFSVGQTVAVLKPAERRMPVADDCEPLQLRFADLA